MNRLPYALTALIFITIVVDLLVVIATAEPTYRHHRRLITDKSLDEVDVNCSDDNANSLKCRMKSLDYKMGGSIDAEKNESIVRYINGKNDDGNKSLNIVTGSNGNNNSDEDDGDNDDDGDGTDNDGGAVEEGRGKKKRKGMGKMLFMMAAAMKGTLLYAMIHGVALLAAKALVIAKIALVLAAAVALKKALDHPDKTSYEIVKHPQHSYSQTHSSSVDYDHHGGFEGHRRRRRRRFIR